MQEIEKIDFKEIATYLKSGSRYKRLETVKYLNKLGNVKAIEILIDCFANDIWVVRQAACKALVNIGDLAFDQICSALEGDNEDKCYWAIKYLVNFPQKAVTPLIKAVKHPNVNVSFWAIEALGEIKCVQAIELLINTFSDENWQKRFKAYEALKKIGYPAAKALKGSFRDNLSLMGNEDVAYWSLKTLANILGPKGLAVLQKFLKAKDETIRFYAVNAIGEVKNKDAVPFLIAMFADPSWVIRKQASDILVSFGEIAVEHLKRSVMSKNVNIQYWSLRALAMILKDEAIESLAKVLKSNKKELKFFAIEALGKIRTEKSAELLIQMFKDKSWLIRKQAADSLVNIGNIAIEKLKEHAYQKEEDIKYWSIICLGRISGNALDVIFELLQSDDTDTRKFAIKALRDVKELRIIPHLILRLKDDYWPNRRDAAEIIAGFGKSCIEAVMSVFTHKDEDFNYWAIKILSSLKDEAVEQLVHFLHHGKLDLRPHAIFTLAKIGTKKSLNVIIEIFRANDETDCAITVTALEDMDDEAFFDSMIEYLMVEDEIVCSWISKVIAKIGRFHPKKVIRALDIKVEKVRFYVASAAIRIVNNEIIPVCINLLLNDESFKIRKELLKIIASMEEIEDPRIIDALIEIMQTQDGDMRETAMRVLAEQGHKKAFNAFIDLINRCGEKDREYLVNTIKKHMDLEYARELLLNLKDSRGASKQAVVDLLIYFGEVHKDTAREIFVEALVNEEDEIVVNELIYIISTLKGTESIEDLIDYFRNVDVHSRRVKILDVLTSRMIHDTMQIREVVNLFLSEVARTTMEYLLELFILPETDEFKTMTLMQLLEEMGEDIVPHLNKVIEGEYREEIKKIARDVLENIKRSAGIGVKRYSSFKKKI